MTGWFIGSALIAAISWIAWLSLILRDGVFPEKTPIHWNIHMEIDGWTTAAAATRGLILMPLFMSSLLAMNWAVKRFSPESFADRSIRDRLDFTIFLSMAFFLFVSGLVIMAMRSGTFPVNLLMGMMFVFFGMVSFTMRGLKPNRWIGVRTPWTMNDADVWKRTHDFTAWLWAALAGIGLTLVLFNVPPLYFLGLLLPLGVAPVIASYVFSRAKG